MVRLETTVEHRFRHPVVVEGETEEDCQKRTVEIAAEVRKAVTRATHETLKKPFFDRFAIGYVSAVAGLAAAVLLKADPLIAGAVIVGAHLIGRKVSGR